MAELGTIILDTVFVRLAQGPIQRQREEMVSLLLQGTVRVSCEAPMPANSSKISAGVSVHQPT